MAENKCPVCSREIKQATTAEWVSRWGEEQWRSLEFRRFLIDELEDAQKDREKLAEILPLYENQQKYIETLERQIELLQKTLDLAEKFAPRPIFTHVDGEVIK